MSNEEIYGDALIIIIIILYTHTNTILFVGFII